MQARSTVVLGSFSIAVAVIGWYPVVPRPLFSDRQC